MTTEDIDWLFAIETAANDACEFGDLEAHDFFLEWYHALRDGIWAEGNRHAQSVWEAAQP